MEKKMYTVEDYLKRHIAELKGMLTALINVHFKVLKCSEINKLENECRKLIDLYLSIYPDVFPDEIVDDVHEILRKHVEKNIKKNMKKLEGYK